MLAKEKESKKKQQSEKNRVGERKGDLTPKRH